MAILETVTPEPDLREVINNLKVMITEMAKNQQPTTTTINRNNDSINAFLSDKCHNACDIRKFMAAVDFSKENYQNILKDCVGGN